MDVRSIKARAAFACAMLGAAILILGASPAAALADPCDPPAANPVACENTHPGTSENTWGIDGAGDPQIQGFATSMSVDVGETIHFKVKSQTPSFHANVYRIGYYGGNGARLVAGGLQPTGPSTQPACLTDSSSGLIDCGNWSVSMSWTVPSDAVSGVYVVHLLRNDTGGDSHITFVVRDDDSTSDMVYVTADTTWQAYNTWGGNSLYQCTVDCPPGNPLAYKGAYKVSYNRPFHSAEDDIAGRSWFYNAEYQMVRFLEHSGYDVSYLSDVDAHARGALLRNHKAIVTSGHDEYWSQTMRDNVENARDAGVSLAFFTGNEIFWKSRWEPSISSGAAADRTLVSYKDTHFTTPQDPVEWTGTWRDPRFATTLTRPIPENALTGQSFVVNAGTSHITVPAEYGRLRLWRNTAAADLQPGQSLDLAPSTLGFEWDEDADNGFRPPGLLRLSSTTVAGVDKFADYGSKLTVGTATHNLTSYRASSGALVFGAGTVQWSWGLDDYLGREPDLDMQQATTNLFADMGVQPATPLPGVVGATKSTDTSKPTSVVTSPAAGASFVDGTMATIAGTASDAGGGRVAGVEVSTDGGTTWHPATSGTESWTYSWLVHGHPYAAIRTRAVDDSGNIEVPGAGISLGVTCPCSIWGEATAPPVADSGDPGSLEVGVKFRSDAYGEITGVRFYKSVANTGTHTGSLWTTSGTRLAQAVFTSESASGWQTATFATPVPIQPGTTYIASYFAPNGHYSATAAYLYDNPAPGPNGGSIAESRPLYALRNLASNPNGVFAYNATSRFPVNSVGAANYWVDVAFQPILAPGPVTGVTAAAAGRTSATVSWAASSSGGQPSSYRVTPRLGGVAQTPTTISGSPPETSATIVGLTNGATYSFTVQAINPAGAGAESAPSNYVTPLDPVAPSAPTNVRARPATQAVLVTWSPPGSDGDSPIASYTVATQGGPTPIAPVTVGGSITSATVDGLRNGATYTFTVTATNAIGDGPASTQSSPATPQSTILDFGTPSTVDSGDGAGVELGLKFTPAANGAVTGVRFYKSTLNVGTHVGNLWTTAGTNLARATFTSESSSGWQTVLFSTPVAVTAGTTYVASYYAPSGHYSASSLPAGGIANGLVSAVPDSTSPNGVYAYGSATTFPAQHFNATNYWVDVLLAVPPPGQVTGVTAAEAGPTTATVSWSVPTGGPPSSYAITPYDGALALPATTVSGSPPATSTTITGLQTDTAYTFTVRAQNASGPGPESAHTGPVTPTTAVVPPAPGSVLARPATSSALVSWTASNADAAHPVTSYTITAYAGSTAQATVSAPASATSATVTGLTNGTSYVFRVSATNAIGVGPESTPSAAVTPYYTIFDFATPASADSGDTNAVEVGVKFQPDTSGLATGIRFYKSAANTGTHSGSLWTAAGTRLAQATFTGESATGWQAATFSTPVALTSGTTYVASYFAPKGRYAATSNAFATAGAGSPPLRALATTTSANGVYAYGSTSAFPASTFNASNYWVDVLYDVAAPGQVTNVVATAGSAAANVSWSAPSGGGQPTRYTITPFIGAVAQASTTVTGTPPATSALITGLTDGTPYTFRVTASNVTGSGAQSAASNAVTPESPTVPGAPTAVTATGDTKSAIVSWTAPANDGGRPITGYRVTPFVGAVAQPAVDVGVVTRARVPDLQNATAYTFTVRAINVLGVGPPSAASNAATPDSSIFEFATPATLDSGDTRSVVLGVKFRSDVAGSVTGVRFYKAATNTGSHTGALWTSTGTLLAQTTFSDETASGWQFVRFATPVPISAGTTYVASYLARNGHYSVTPAAFTSAGTSNPPLLAVASPVSANGVYVYATTSAFPTSTFNAANYWVDVLFAPAP